MCKNSSREYWWDFYDVPHNDKSNLILRPYYNNSANQPNGVTITFAKEAIEAGLKKLVFTVNLTDREGGILSDYIYVDFKTPPVIAQIIGGSEIFHDNFTDLIVDASSSRDPVERYYDQPFNFTWDCVKVPDSDVAMLENFTGRFGTPNAIQPSPSWNKCLSTDIPKQERIVIPAAQLQDGFYFLFTVTVEKINETSAHLPIQRNDTAFQSVKIIPYKAPKVQLM